MPDTKTTNFLRSLGIEFDPGLIGTPQSASDPDTLLALRLNMHRAIDAAMEQGMAVNVSISGNPDKTRNTVPFASLGNLDPGTIMAGFFTADPSQFMNTVAVLAMSSMDRGDAELN